MVKPCRPDIPSASRLSKVIVQEARDKDSGYNIDKYDANFKHFKLIFEFQPT